MLLPQHDLHKYRLAFEGGKNFVNTYLQKFSAREEDTEFVARKNMSHCPAFAKAAVLKIRNAIYQRLTEVKRIGGPVSYQKAKIDAFIGLEVLPELLVARTVGVFIDREDIPEQVTKADKPKSPYFRLYCAEHFKHREDDQGEITHLELIESVQQYDDFGLPTNTTPATTRYRVVDGKVQMSVDQEPPITLNLVKIPFVIFEISHSLLIDAADYQISLLNIESSDLNYILYGNFPFYTEQQKFTNSDHLKTSPAPGELGPDEITVGATKGRRYPIGADRPEFIAPPTEPLLASMKKAEVLKDDIERLVLQAVTTLGTEKEATLEAGLSYIGKVLEAGERQIAVIWAMYEGEDEAATVNYPKKYTLKSTKEILDEATAYTQQIGVVPSETYKKEIAKTIATTLLEGRISSDQMDKIISEIDAAKVLIPDPEIIYKALENSLIGLELAAQTIGIPPEQVAIAKAEHAERLARIQAAQTSTDLNGGARGVNDQTTDPTQSAKNEKVVSQDPTTQPDGQKAVRGEAK